MEQELALRDIHLPDPISWWPPAIGWWLLLILIPLSIFSVWWLYKRLTRRTAIKTAQSLLTDIKSDQDSDDLQKLQQLSTWLRRVVISIAPRQQSAGLTGMTWLRYLDSSVEGSPFSDGVGQCLIDAQYRKVAPDNIDTTALFELCETWLKGQKT